MPLPARYFYFLLCIYNVVVYRFARLLSQQSTHSLRIFVLRFTMSIILEKTQIVDLQRVIERGYLKSLPR